MNRFGSFTCLVCINSSIQPSLVCKSRVYKLKHTAIKSPYTNIFSSIGHITTQSLPATSKSGWLWARFFYTASGLDLTHANWEQIPVPMILHLVASLSRIVEVPPFAPKGNSLLLSTYVYVQGKVHTNRKVQSSFTDPHVILNPYEFLSSTEHKGRMFMLLFSKHTMLNHMDYFYVVVVSFLVLKVCLMLCKVGSGRSAWSSAFSD